MKKISVVKASIGFVRSTDCIAIGSKGTALKYDTLKSAKHTAKLLNEDPTWAKYGPFVGMTLESVGRELMTEFAYAFKVKHKVIFTVRFYTVGTNPRPHFSTVAYKFNYIRSDWVEGGQAQDRLLPKNSLAMRFYKQWDSLHIQDLTIEQYDAIVSDIEKLKEKYHYIEGKISKYGDGLNFYNMQQLDRQKKGLK